MWKTAIKTEVVGRMSFHSALFFESVLYCASITRDSVRYMHMYIGA